jgi:formylglycine-generating enzyme required for sulfatase activity
MAPSTITKEQFLANLENALNQLMLKHILADADAATKTSIKADIREFIQQNVAEYSLEELTETFISAETTVGLFLEYQEAKRIVGEETTTSTPSQSETSPCNSLQACQPEKGQPVFPSDSWQEPHTGIEMVWVHGTAFQMGSGSWDDQGHVDEKPVHDVLLDGYWICRYPVTVAQYSMFSTAVKRHEPAWLETDSPYNIYTGPNPLYKDLGNSITCDAYPITGISWIDATAFTSWLNELTGHSFRLPTEAEWEYAARSGGKEEKYAGQNEVTEVAWFAENSQNSAHPVGVKQPNGLGIFDMCGNVSEWCEDLYQKEAYRQHRHHNPLNTEKGSCRVVRGGSWQYGARDVRCADRGLFVPDYRGCDLGFRIVRSA